MTKPTGRPVGGQRGGPNINWDSHREDAIRENIRDLRAAGESDDRIEKRLGIDLKKMAATDAVRTSRKERRGQGDTDPHAAA